MSDEAAEKSAPEAEDKPKKSSLSLATILLLVNVIAVGAAAGMLVYTKILFKRPAITEETERKRLEAIKAKASAVGSEAGVVEFEPLTANIAGSNGRKRYATVGFALEIRDKNRAGDVETVRALIIDRFLSILGKKQMTELNQVQGRFVLRSEMIDAVNQVIYNNAGSLQAAKAAVKAQPSKEGAKEGGEGGEGGEKKEGGEAKEGGEKKEGAPKGEGHGGAEATGAKAAPIQPIRDLVTDVFFTQFIVQ